MKMFLTRMGQNARIVVTGDITQVDLPPGVRSGLADAVERLGRIPGVGTVLLDRPTSSATRWCRRSSTPTSWPNSPPSATASDPGDAIDAAGPARRPEAVRPADPSAQIPASPTASE